MRWCIMSERSKSIGIDILAFIAGLAAVWCVVAQVVDQGMGVLSICLAVPLGLASWGLWRRAVWGLYLAVIVAVLGLLTSPAVVLCGYQIATGDSIGAGILMFYGFLGSFTITPVFALVLWYLLRANTRAHFSTRRFATY